MNQRREQRGFSQPQRLKASQYGVCQSVWWLVAEFLILFIREKGPVSLLPKKGVGGWPNEELIYPLVLSGPWTGFHKLGDVGLQHSRVYALSPLSAQYPAACGWSQQLRSTDTYWRYTKPLRRELPSTLMAQICVWGRISEEGKSIYIGHATHLSLGNKEKSNKATHLPLNKPLPNLQPLPAPPPKQPRALFSITFLPSGTQEFKAESSHSCPQPNGAISPFRQLGQAADAATWQ